MAVGRPKFSWKLNSTVGMFLFSRGLCENTYLSIDVGTITDLSIRTVWGKIANSNCTVLAEIRVVDLRDTVYVTTFRNQSGRKWAVKVIYLYLRSSFSYPKLISSIAT